MPRTINSKTPLKYGAIAGTLRSNITSGEWRPGQQLPTRPELLSTFDAGMATVQRALDRLMTDGFIETTNRGTFVSSHPPHLYRYAIVFPARDDGTHHWTNF